MPLIIKDNRNIEELKKQYRDHLKEADNWGEMETGIEGVVVIKIPMNRSNPAKLALKIDPVEDGRNLLKKKLFVTNTLLYNKLKAIFTSSSTDNLFEIISDINTKKTTKKLIM